jgi:hypothetical protein
MLLGAVITCVRLRNGESIPMRIADHCGIAHPLGSHHAVITGGKKPMAGKSPSGSALREESLGLVS